MTYQADDSSKSKLLVPKPLEPESKPMMRLTPTNRLRPLAFVRLLDALWRHLRESTGRYRSPLSERWLLLVVVDSLCVVAATWLAERTAPAFISTPGLLWRWFPVLLAGWWCLAYVNNLYDVPSSGDGRAGVARGMASVGLGLALYMAIRVSLGYPWLDLFGLYFAAIFLILILAWRLTYAGLSNRLFAPHRILVVGLNDQRRLLDPLHKPAARLNFEIVGAVGEQEAEDPDGQVPYLGPMKRLPELIQTLDIHEVVVNVTQPLTPDLFDLLISCQGEGIQVTWMADLYARLNYCIPIEHIRPWWALDALQGRPLFSRTQLVGKRCLDLALVLLGLPMLLLLMPIIALAIRLDSPGPIFYRQTRVGRGGRLFSIFKFRTMVPNAEQPGAPQWATKDDKRITRVGRFLRTTHLDELPQIFNILRGEMSFVGPRPERPEFVEKLEREIPFYRTRLLVKPGLTGWAQIHYDYGNSVEDAMIKLQFDFHYIRHWSLWKDVYILFRTLVVVIQRKGT
ncbi:sugar transferase [Litorilinea aerophila]|nr:sugar transferase [Litorilinea aerophila]